MRKFLIALLLLFSAAPAFSAVSGNILPYRNELLIRVMQNWEPKDCMASVVISLVIAKDGTLLKHEVWESSGSKKCDGEALSAANQTQYPPLPNWYRGGPLEFRIRLDPALRLYRLAMVSYDHGKYAEAERLFKRALEIRKRVLGPNHPDVAESLKGYAFLLRMTNRLDKAAKLEAEAKAIEDNLQNRAKSVQDGQK